MQEVEYFGSPEYGIMMMNEIPESRSESFANGLTISGSVEKGGQKTQDDTPVFVRIFNGNWEEIAYQEIEDGGSYSVTASGSDVYHVKFECNGYLPFYLKDFGTGAYQIGSSESKDTVTLVPGDTTYNEWAIQSSMTVMKTAMLSRLQIPTAHLLLQNTTIKICR